MHIGHLIRNVLDEKRISVRQFAMMANSERTNMYRILDRESIDLSVLERYSRILDHNFFQDLSDEYKKQYKNSWFVAFITTKSCLYNNKKHFKLLFDLLLLQLGNCKVSIFLSHWYSAWNPLLQWICFCILQFSRNIKRAKRKI